MDGMTLSGVALAGMLLLTLRFLPGRVAKSLGAGLAFVVLALVSAEVHWEKQREQARTQAAADLFTRYCHTAGEKVFRRVDDVQGLRLRSTRPKARPPVPSRTDWAEAGSQHELRDLDHIRTFLYAEQRDGAARGYLSERPSRWPGYRFVDVMDPDGVVYRYRLAKDGSNGVSREPATAPAARYMVSYANMADPVDDRLWIAGTKAWITDIAHNEVIAERTWYSIEQRAQPGDPAATTPPVARACPDPRWLTEPVRFFVDQVLRVRPAS